MDYAAKDLILQIAKYHNKFGGVKPYL